MALVTQFTCSRSTCRKETYGLVRPDRLCYECVEADCQVASKTRRVYLAGLTGLTVEERLAQLEAHLYDLNAAARLGVLENRNVTY